VILCDRLNLSLSFISNLPLSRTSTLRNVCSSIILFRPLITYNKKQNLASTSVFCAVLSLSADIRSAHNPFLCCSLSLSAVLHLRYMLHSVFHFASLNTFLFLLIKSMDDFYFNFVILIYPLFSFLKLETR